MADAARPDAPLAALCGVGLRRGGRWLVQDVDLEVRAGEIVTLIGPNGGGKTTVLRLLLGLLTPEVGRVERRAGLTVGYLPQHFAVEPVLPLTVARLMTCTVRRPRQAVASALAETGVEALIEQQVHALSGGELQRVLLARALLRRPELLVLDEPVQGVDHAGEAALYALIASIRSRHDCGILLVSHDLHMVMAETDRVVCLNHHVCCTGSPQDVTRHAEYLRLFGPQAASALAFYRHAHDHGHDLDGGVLPAGRGEVHRHPH